MSHILMENTYWADVYIFVAVYENTKIILSLYPRPPYRWWGSVIPASLPIFHIVSWDKTGWTKSSHQPWSLHGCPSVHSSFNWTYKPSYVEQIYQKLDRQIGPNTKLTDCNGPADTRRKNNVIMTSKRRRDFFFDVKMTLLSRRVPVGGMQQLPQQDNLLQINPWPLRSCLFVCLFSILLNLQT